MKVLILVLAMVAGTAGSLWAQTVFFSDNFNRANSLDLDAATNGMSGTLMTNGAFAVSNVWLEPIDLGRNNQANAQIAGNVLQLGGQGNSVNIVLDANFATLLSTGILSATLKLNGTPGPNDASATNRYEGVGFAFGRSEGNVVSASVDRVLSRVADVFVAEIANGKLRINDENASLRSSSGDVTPTTIIDLDPNAAAYISGTLRLDFTITNATAGSTVGYAILFDAGSTGGFVTLTNRSFVLSGNYELYAGIENRSTPAVQFDDFSLSAPGAYSPPVSAGLVWRALVNNTWDTTTSNWIDVTFGSGEKFLTGAIVKFDDTTTGATVNVPGTVLPGAVSLENANSNYTFAGAGAIGGAASVAKSGGGNVGMSLNNTYTGGSTLSAGRFRAGNNNALGGGLVTLGGGALSSDSSTARTLSNPVKLTAAATLGHATDNGFLTFNRPVDFGGSGKTLTINSDVVFASGATNGTLASKQGKATLIARGTVNFSGASDVQDGTVIYDGATVTNSDRLIADAGAINGIARLVITNGASITINTTLGNLRAGRTASTGTNYVDVAGTYSIPNADISNGNITLQGNAALSEMTFYPGGDVAVRSVANNNSVGNTVFKLNGGVLRARNDNPSFFEGLSQALLQAGGANIDDSGFAIAINQNLLDGGGGGLNKTGGGTLSLNGANTYVGATIVSNGALGGSGVISGPVQVAAGATLSPGSAPGVIGTLTINSNLTLNASGSVVMEIDKAGATRDQVTGLKNVSYAGTLVVTNISATPFSGGDTFALFSASGTKSGNFSAVTVLPATGITGSFNPATGILTLSSASPGADHYNVYADSANNLLNVLANDSGNGLTLAGLAPPANGTALSNGTNIVYAPNPGFVGTDVFTYTNQDNLAVQTAIPVTISVLSTAGLNDRYQVLRNSSSNKLDVLRNDGAGVTLISLVQPTNGTAVISGTNLVYTPGSNYSGPDNLRYTSQNAQGVTVQVTVILEVRRYPNFVFILSDDQGWTGLSVPMDKNRPDSKSDYYRTPQMEKLAAEAMRFSLGYAPHPNCSPSRYANLTGQTCARLKMTDIVGRSGTAVSNQFKLIAPGKAVNAIQSSNTTIPELLKSIPGAGYSAAHFGKWHLGGGGPVSHGFDADANDGATDNSDGDLGSEPINPDPKQAYGITDRAMAFLDSRVTNGTPFYLQASHYAVHETTQTTQSSYDSYAAVTPGFWHNNRYYAGMTTDLDINVGRLLDKLDALGIRNSTYIFYQGDNGAPQSQSENYPLRGYKPEVWEGGTRVPTFVRGPGVPANSQCNEPVAGIDLLPTIWEWATGSTTNLPANVDGGSLVGLIRSLAIGTNAAPVGRGGELVHHSPHYVGPSPWPDDWMLNPKDMRPRSTIHDGHYKLVANYEPGTIELYDLNSDIGEQTNLSPSQLAIKWQLWVRLRDYLKLVGAQMPTLDPSYRGTTNGDFVLTAATGPFGDADSDGLSDTWEFRELLTYQFNGSDDPDQDGVSNAQELAQGTDPLIPNAYRIDNMTQVGVNQLQLTWNSTPGASFVVESSLNLVNWTPATTVTAGNVFYGSVTVTKTNALEFFRVRKL